MSKNPPRRRNNLNVGIRPPQCCAHFVHVRTDWSESACRIFQRAQRFSDLSRVPQAMGHLRASRDRFQGVHGHTLRASRDLRASRVT